MVYIISAIIALSIVSGILYRLGGWGNDGKKSYPKIPAWVFDTKARDVGCALVTGIAVYTLGITAPIWVHLVSFLMLFWGLTTYWDFLFGYDNHWFHGFICGIAYFPYVIWGSMDLLSFSIRAFLLTILMGLWSKYNPPVKPWGEDETEEFGRGFSLPSTLLLTIFIVWLISLI